MRKILGILSFVAGAFACFQVVNYQGPFWAAIIAILFWGGIGLLLIRSKNKEEEINLEIKEKQKQAEIERQKKKKIAEEEAEQEAIRKANQKEKEKAELLVTQDQVLRELDKDGNGMVDDIEGKDDFNLLLKKHQKDIIEINRDYVKEFVKVSNYLKTKKKNIQKLFNSIKHTSNQKELNDYVGILKNEVHTYNLVLFNSLNMIVALIEDDMITFYEIHDSFDKLNMFNSNWENEVSQKLSNIGDGLNSLMYSINQMGQRIIQEIGELRYVTAESNQNLNSKLEEVDSSLKTNNLLTGIQTYQMYKVNKNTKKIN